MCISVCSCAEPPRCLPKRAAWPRQDNEFIHLFIPKLQGKDLTILQGLKDNGFEHSHVVELYESFQVSGPNGTHSCLVLPALGASLDDLSVKKALAPEVRIQMCQQVASSVAALHDRDICHGGALSPPAELYFTEKSADESTIMQKY